MKKILTFLLIIGSFVYINAQELDGFPSDDPFLENSKDDNMLLPKKWFVKNFCNR